MTTTPADPAASGPGSTESNGPAADDGHIPAARAAEEKVPVVTRRDHRQARGGPVRRVLVALLVLLFAILLPLTLTIAWAHRTVLDNDAWARTVQPIATDPAVTAAVSREVTDQLYAALDPQEVIAGALPPKATFLAAPIANGARGYVEDAVDNVLQSDQFQQIWLAANKTVHAKLVSVLRGDSEVLRQTNGVLVINLVPLLNRALERMQGFASSVVGRDIALPEITGDELPAEACAKVAAALGRELPPTCGQIALFKASELVSAQRAVRFLDRAVLALLIVTPLVAAAALWLSRRRRRTLLQLTLGAMLGLVIVRRSTMWLESHLVDSGRPENEAARRAILHGSLGRFYTLSLWFLIGGLVITLIALLTGPYGWAVSTRRRCAAATRDGRQLVSAAMGAPSGRAADDPAVVWVREHFDALRAGGVVVAVLLLLLFSVDFVGLVVIAGLLALYELALHRLRPPAAVTLPS